MEQLRDSVTGRQGNGTSANEMECKRVAYNKWLVDEVVFAIVVPRPNPDEVQQHICFDKGYDSHFH
ncbi:MAG: hypothetical protein ABI947_26490 [Chloroflexota bacterium]